MSEVQSRPAPSRGRGSGRGGRGGYSSRSGARPANRHSTTNGGAKHDTEPVKSSIEDEGEVGQLKKKYGSKVTLIKEMFADWSEVDILFALHETDGDENLTVTRIAEGTISQWGEVSNPKKERKSKAKGDVFTTTTAESGPGYVRHDRGGRAGIEGGRGRGRATERGGRGGGRGRSAHATNGTRKENQPLSIPTEEASGWDNPQPSDETTTGGWGDDANGWDMPAAADPAPAVPADTSTWDQPAPSFTSAVNTAPTAQKTSIIPEGTQKTWASMLRQSTAPKPAPKPKEVATPEPIEASIERLPPVDSVLVEAEHEFATAGEIMTEHAIAMPEIAEATHMAVPEPALLPPQDQLTESNLEQVAGAAIMGPATETLKSETASSYDPRAAIVSATASPISASQQHHQLPRVPTSGYAATALKATERGVIRTPSYQRRVLDQEEAVRLPRGREQVEHAALQFGAMGLDDEDVDGDREEPETRAQPPDDSPTAHPRTSLPPVQPTPALDSYPAQAASAIPTGPACMTYKSPGYLGSNLTDHVHAAVAAPLNAPSHPAASVASQGMTVRSPRPEELKLTRETVAPGQAPPQPSQFGSRFGHAAPPEQPAFPTPKPFDTFGQSSAPAAQSQYEAGFPHMSQAQSMPQAPQPHQQPSNAFTTAPGDYSTYYTADAQSRSTYNNYYGQGFNQQTGSQAQDNAPQAQHQQRAYNSYGVPQNDNLSQYPQSAAHHAPSRYGNTAGVDAQNSGNNTPNPTGPQTQQQTGQNSQGQSHGQQQQSHGQQQSHDYASYGGHPYFTSPYYTQYMGGYPGNYNQGAYGAPYGKNHMGYGGQQAGYGMQGPQGYASSPASGFESTLRSESGSAPGLSGSYGRGGSGGPQGLVGGSAFGGVPDAFGRSVSGYQGQGSQAYSAAGSQPGNGPPVGDDLKPYGDAKGAGPSPSLAAAARPGSAANNGPSQSGLPPPQGVQAGLGGYPGYANHLQGHGGHGGHANQSGAGTYGMGGSGNQGGHQNSYGGYGQGFGGGNYYGNQQQARGGWGSNYH